MYTTGICHHRQIFGFCSGQGVPKFFGGGEASEREHSAVEQAAAGVWGTVASGGNDNREFKLHVSGNGRFKLSWQNFC